MSTLIRLKCYLYFFYLLLYFVPVKGQNCKNGANGTVCDYPPDLDLQPNIPTVIVGVSSFCNTSILLQNGQTSLCDANPNNIYDRVTVIPGSNYTDGNYVTFWASSLTRNPNGSFNEQTITINFTDIFLITSIKIAFGTNATEKIDMRPNSMEIWGYDGTWRTWFSFGTDCTGRSPCEQKSIIIPSYSLVEYIPINIYGDNLYTNVAIQRQFLASLLQIRLKTPPLSSYTNFNDTLSYFMISDISIRYRCACNGHSSVCGGVAGGICNCDHFTAGNNCEMCAPAYNNVTWQMASSLNPFQCQVCDCNGRSKACQYDPVDMSGDCTACENGTSGKYCENCNTGYYLNPVGGVNVSTAGSCAGYDGNVTLTYNCSDICIPCNCSTVGSMDPKSCNYTGYCSCKTRVTGRICDTCIDGSFSLSPTSFEGCTVCDCDTRGIVTCDKTNGTCICKNNTFGGRCDACKPTYYNLDANNPAGCTDCSCDFGASLGDVCDATSGVCPCKSFTTTRTCESAMGGYFGPRLDYYTFEAEYSTNVTTSDIVERVGGGSDGSTFTGRGFLNINSTKALTFYVRVLTSAWYYLVLRYESALTFAVTATLNPTVNITTLPITVCQNYTPSTLTGTVIVKDKAGFTRLAGPTCLVLNVDYELKVNIPIAQGVQANGFLLDSVVLFPVVENLTAYAARNDSVKLQMRQCFESDMIVSDANRTILGCPAIDYSLMIDLNGVAYSCNCDPSGSYNQSCASQGGQCPCLPNMLLRNCSQCAVNTFGFIPGVGCQACNCHPNASLTLKCSDNGTCSCRANVTGDKCDKCIDKHFGLTTGNGCQPCLCSGSYVVNDSCLDSGQCFCKPGVAGIKCDVCAQGFYGLTTSGCSACGCNALGSLTSLCNPSNGQCQCRAKVTGFLCDSCVQEYFGLGPYNNDGCIQCYCSGMSKNCTSALGWYQAYSASNPNLFTGPTFGDNAWTGSDKNGSSIPADIGSLLDTSQLCWTITNYDVSTDPLYFVSPVACTTETCFNGFKAASYGQWLNISLMFNQYPPSSPSGGPLLPILPYPQGDVIIRSSNVTYAIVAVLNFTTSAPTTYSIRMNEASWYKDSPPNPLTYAEMIQLLYNVKSISIRAKFSQTNGSTASLINVTLGYGSKDSNFNRVPLSTIEHCICPSPYEGDFCERCSAGYTKVNNVCVLCTCNGHQYPGTTCDPYTGKCTCAHNTAGDHCELCMPGYYGDATQQLPDSCKACMCPGNVNDPLVLSHSSSRTCNTTGTSFICNCDVSFTGSRCDVCSYGYYGVPANATINGGGCTACLCGGTNNCDNVTGVCSSCPSNTAGVNCGQCLPDYYSTVPFSQSCSACSCNKAGSAAPCDSSTGACNCLPGIDPSTNCTSCLAGYYNLTNSGCSACNCNAIIGTVDGQANCTNGQCSCKPNFVGPTCTQCVDQMYGNDCSSNCSCLTNYTVNGNASCSKDGQCQCLEGYGNPKCDTCVGDATTYPDITNQSPGVFPLCTSCGPCFRSIANKSDILNQNLTAIQGQTNSFLQQVIAGQLLPDINTRVINLGLPLNTSDTNVKRLIALKDNLTNVNLYDVPAQLLAYDVDLQNFKANQTNLTTRTSNLEAIDPNSIQTGDAVTPTISIPNINNTFHSIVDNQTQSFSRGTADYNEIISSDALVQNQAYSVDGLRSRVEAVNASIAQSNASITNALGQLNGISIPGLQSRLNIDDQRTKATQSLVNSLSSDIAIAQFYLSSSMTVHDSAKQRLDAFSNQYDIWNRQLALNGSLQNFSNFNQQAAQSAADSASRHCNLTQSMNDGVTNAIVNLSNAKKQIETSNLTNSINTIQSINSINLDPYSNQIIPIINSINGLTVQPDLISGLSRDADNSSSLAQNLINIIQDAVNKTQSTQAKMNQLLSNMNSSSNQDTQTKTCLNGNTAQTTAISTNLDSVTRKANETRIAAASTSQAMSNASLMFSPVTSNFANVTNTITTARNNLQLVNNTLDAVQFNELRNTNNMVLLNTNYTNRLSEYSTWSTTKTQVDSCLNDLWTSFNILNSPVKLTDLALQTQDQLNQINQLMSDINSLESEINALLTTINNLGTSNVACTENTSG